MHKVARFLGVSPAPLAAVIVFCSAVALYVGVVGYGFVRWDDGMLIYENPAIRGITPATLWWVFTHFDPELYIPVTFISYQINYLIGGIDPTVYKLTNVLLHGANASLVLWLVLRLTGRLRIAAFCALLFAAHPLHVEAVAWASGRKDLLSGFFFLAAWIMVLRGEQEGSARSYRASVALHLLAVLSKVMAATLPAAILLETAVFRPRDLRRTATLMIPHLAISAVFIVVAAVGKEHLVVATTLLQKVLMACVSSAFYLHQIFWPVRFSLLYPWTGDIGIGVPLIALAVVVVSVLLVSAAAAWRRVPIWTFCILGFFGTVAPTFVNFNKGGALDVYFASDRYAYIPSVFVFLLIAVALDRLCATLERRGMPSPYALVVTFVIAVLSVLTWRQEQVWKDTRTLFAHVIAVYPDASYVAHNNLGNMERLANNLDAAVAEFRASLDIRQTPRTWSNLGAVYRKQGRMAEARAAYDSALAIDPNDPYAHFGLGIVAAEEGNVAAARKEYETALQVDPAMEEVWLNLGALFASQRQWTDAVDAYRRALAINPFFVAGQHNLGVALLQLGDAAGAEAAFREAVRLNPGYVPSRLNLGVLLAKRGEREAARAQFQAVLQVDPHNRTAQSALSQL